MKLHPQNDTPGDMGPAPSIEPVTMAQIVDCLDLIACALRRNGSDYYTDAIISRISLIKKQLG